jgi:hypothetical protein
MLTEEGRFWVLLVLFLVGIFASGYFMGWTREKLSAKILDKMFHYLDKARYWEGRLEDVIEENKKMYEKYRKLQEYILEDVGPEHLPVEFGGELE